jgi:phosphatidylglycerol lysyltransferase
MPVALVALITLGSGLINLYSVVIHSLPGRMAILEDVFPFEFIHVSRLITLLIGFALIISAINIYKRKQRAYYAVLLLSSLSIVFHLTKGLNYEEAIASVVLLVVLVIARDRFTVRSGVPDLSNGLFRFAVAACLAFAYGIAGFWFLDRRDFGINFHIGDAFRETLRYLAFMGNPSLVPHTRHARFFIDSLYVTTATAIVYSLYSLFRPALYRLRTLPRERAVARSIVEKHGRSSLDFFKFWPDKSFFFSRSRESFISYGVGRNFAIALGDPVGPDAEIEDVIHEFDEFCRENDWSAGFHQTLPDFLPLYERLGFKKLKVGDDAIIDLATFSLDGKEHKAPRHIVNKLEGEGIQFRRYDPPISEDVLSQARRISDEWLEGRGRRERRFTLGAFEPRYVRSTPLAAARNANGTILSFVNIIPSYAKGEATIDLMRFGAQAPVGIMDYLFAKLFLDLKARGYARFSLGMSPMSGFQEGENPSVEEKAVHSFFQHLNFLFSYQGLKRYKSKFATSWEPRYAIYKTQLDLPRLALALREVSEIRTPSRAELESTGAEADIEDDEDELISENP